MTPGHGQIAWTELMTDDCGAAMSFYETVCGWEFTSVPAPVGEGQYHIGMAGGQMVAGMMAIGEADGAEVAGPQWLSYVAVADLEQAVARVTDAGGTLLRPIFEVPGTGHIAMIHDPRGAVLGLMQQEPMDAPAEDGDEDDLIDNLPV